MKWFYLLLAGVMAVRNLWLAARSRAARRWLLVAFWVCFGALVLVQRPPMRGGLPVGLLLIGWLLTRNRWWLYAYVMFGPRLGTEMARHALRRRMVENAVFWRRLLVWTACWLRGQPLLVVYRGDPILSDLIEAHLLPQLTRRAVVIKDWLPRESHRFSVFERMVVRSIGDLGRLPLIARLRPLADPHRFDPRKALWLHRNGRPQELGRLVAAVLGSARPAYSPRSKLR